MLRPVEQREPDTLSGEHSSGAGQELEAKIAQVTQNKFLWE